MKHNQRTTRELKRSGYSTEYRIPVRIKKQNKRENRQDNRGDQSLSTFTR